MNVDFVLLLQGRRFGQASAIHYFLANTRWKLCHGLRTRIEQCNPVTRINDRDEVDDVEVMHDCDAKSE